MAPAKKGTWFNYLNCKIHHDMKAVIVISLTFVKLKVKMEKSEISHSPILTWFLTADTSTKKTEFSVEKLNLKSPKLCCLKQ